MQRLMLMHSIRVPGSSTLSNQFRYRVSGPLDVDRFERAWQRALDRHPALRTAFVWEGVDEPLQVVRSRARMTVEHVDLGGHDAADRAAELAHVEQADREQGFDLTRAPLMRLTVVSLSDEQHVLLWSRHHLILDLWSVELLFDEVLRHYGGRQQAVGNAVGFRDYIQWLGQQDATAAEAHYQRVLAGLSAPSLLFGDRARRSEWFRDGQPVAERILAAECVAAIAEFARSRGLTFGSVVQGAVGLMIAERLRRADVVYGLTVAGRPSDLDSVASILGTFINDVPVRAQIDRSQRIIDWLVELQIAHSKRQPFEYLSPIDIHRCSGLPAERPLFDLLLLLQSPGATTRPTDGSLTLDPIRGPFDSALPMTLAVEHEGAEVRLTAVYDESLVSGDVAEGILRQLEDWLRRICARPDATLGDLLPEFDAAEPARPSPAPAAVAQDSAGVADTLLDIWRRTLGIADVGLDDDFFALGGTSIQAAIAFTEIERRLGRDLPLSILFAAGNV
ncbi:MAG: condensation domain-containing protein, partial [Gammaproteobacteria bacterium]